MMTKKEIEKLKNLARKSCIKFYEDYPTKFCIFKSLTLQELSKSEAQYISNHTIGMKIGKSVETVYFLMSAIGFLHRKYIDQQIFYSVTKEGSFYSKNEKEGLVWNEILVSLLLEYIRLESE